MHVFVVDREPVIVAALRSFMGELGHEVSTADSVLSVLNELRRGTPAPDLLLVDFHHATEGASDLQTLTTSHPRTRVAVMATEGASLPAGYAVATPTAAYLRKPISFKAVEELLQQTSGELGAPASAAAASPSDQNATDPRVPTRVLVVDDSPLIHTMYRTILRQQYPAITIFKAMNGREALDLLAIEGAIDLILLDINMPVMNGIQFLENLALERADDDRDSPPVIVVTTEGKEEDAVRGLRRGAKGYLVKPFRPDVLCRLIETILNKARTHGR